jgi:hypothetical protein
MSSVELERALRGLRLSGMIPTLEARALQVTSHEMTFLEAFSWLVQDELDRRSSRLQDRRFAFSGLPERKTLAELDWSYNPRLPKRDLLELGTLKFIDAHEDVLLIGSPGTGKSHVAKALALLAVERGYKVLYREAQQLIEDITEARELGTIRKGGIPFTQVPPIHCGGISSLGRVRPWPSLRRAQDPPSRPAPGADRRASRDGVTSVD